ncbi:hypothetical protein CVIRNUC_000663 [Coccomyxa viridis]|uniref:Fibronectin type-III domain-containing protein n=1 Tax=Coccomyxa viridis TaxID=1274662 RepID=A0AAV1HQW8_9CHLO|nr:hypothetical protein CVIRNUC_000663 [Coccomyxa viridis]
MSDQLEAKQGAAAKDADDPSQTTEKVEELPKPVPGFEAAQAPKLIAVDTTSISLQWQSVAQLPADEAAQAYSRSLGDDVVLPNCDVEYCLQTRQMGPRESKADLSIPNVTWQNCYRGKDTFTQVRNLRPGRRYAYRIVIKPDVVPPWADPPEQPPSAAEIYETPATVPMPPKPIKCTRRERAAFELRWFEPGETGGRPIQEYTAQMRPPPADAAGQHPNLEGFVEIYRGRENRHRQKNLAHATEYEFRLKASPSSTLRILIAQNSLKQSRGAYL